MNVIQIIKGVQEWLKFMTYLSLSRRELAMDRILG